MENGERGMENGEWRTGNGVGATLAVARITPKGGMVAAGNGERGTENGEKKTP
jgi:hypothetical protein